MYSNFANLFGSLDLVQQHIEENIEDLDIISRVLAVKKYKVVSLIIILLVEMVPIGIKYGIKVFEYFIQICRKPYWVRDHP